MRGWYRICSTGFVVLGVLSAKGSSAVAGSPDPTAAMKGQVAIQKLSSLPLAFTENHGQWNKSVLFQAQTQHGTIWFTSEGVVFQSLRPLEADAAALRDHTAIPELGPMSMAGKLPDVRYEQQIVRSNFVDANPDPRVSGEEPMVYRCNYFIGNDRAKWHTDVPNFARIVYHDLYPGIDLAFYGKDGAVEYDFIVHPGADPGDIALHYEGPQHTCLDQYGDLVLVTPWGEMTHRMPQVYQLAPDGSKSLLSGGFCVTDDGLVRMDVPEAYNPELALVIDPVLSYGTYLGGGLNENCTGMAVSPEGFAYVTGTTYSTDFPLLGPLPPPVGSFSAVVGEDMNDAFVTKLSPNGDARVYSTYLGGDEGYWESQDYAYAIAVDANGAAYITGATMSDDFPTVNAFDPTRGHSDVTDAFISKISPAGNVLEYSTYFGGTAVPGDGTDAGYAIAVDNSGSAYVTGATNSVNLPVVSAYDPGYNGNSDVFILKIAPSGNPIQYCTYLGGTFGCCYNPADVEAGLGIAIDATGAAYVAGRTVSSDFPAVNSLQTYAGGTDGFVAKLSPTGDQLLYSTFVGGNLPCSGCGSDPTDEATAIAIDQAGSAYVTGFTYTTDFPIVNPVPGGGTHDNTSADAFALKINHDCSQLLFSTLLGGTGLDAGSGIKVDALGAAFVTGTTQSSNFPLVNAFDVVNDGGDAFVARLSPDGENLAFSTYVGGSASDGAQDVGLDKWGRAYVNGNCGDGFPATLGASDNTYNGNGDGFVVKISGPSFTENPREGDLTGNPAMLHVTFDEITPSAGPWSWDFGDGSPIDYAEHTFHNYTAPGVYAVTLTVGSVSSTDYVVVHGIVADFTADQRAGGLGLNVTFTDNSTGTPTHWQWDFGDPASGDLNYSSSGSVVSHVYSTAGRYTVTLTASGDFDNSSSTEVKLDYILVDVTPAPDLEVTLTDSRAPHRGLNESFYMSVRNIRATASNPTLLHFPIPAGTICVATAPNSLPVDGVVTWSVPTMEYGDPGATYQVLLQIPMVDVGTPLELTCHVDPVTNEPNLPDPENNNDTLHETIVASIDPNDMTVQPGGCGPAKSLIQGTPSLTYNILFENKPTASGNAIYVMIVDTLDPDLDWGTLEIGPTIRDSVVTVNFDPFSGEIRWFFDGIDLPPNVNAPEGEGFVNYTIKPKAGLPDGTDISSRAHIRFDFEPWLSAPDAGPLALTIQPCPPPCGCPCKYDPQCDSVVSDVLDVVSVINVAFRGLPSTQDLNCPAERSDVDANGATDVIDVTKVINVAFRGQTAATNYVDPCQ